MTTDSKIINGWLEEAKKDLIINYDRLGLRASGNWAETLEQFTQMNNKGFVIGMKGERYTGALEGGRKKNADQTPEALQAWVGWAGSTILAQWVEDKGLDISPYAVAWKIALQGWIVPNKHNAGGLVTDVITSARLNKLDRDLALRQIADYKSDLIKGFGNGNNSN